MRHRSLAWRRTRRGGWCLRFASAKTENQAGATAVERAGDFSWDLNLALHPAASDESGIKPRKNVRERQAHKNPIPIIFGSENLRNSLAQFAKGNFDGAA
jgi:hypothetical protein